MLWQCSALFALFPCFFFAISFNDDSYEEEKKNQNIWVIPWYHSVLKPQREQESRYAWLVGSKCNSRFAWPANWLVTYNIFAKASFIFIFFANLPIFIGAHFRRVCLLVCFLWFPLFIDLNKHTYILTLHLHALDDDRRTTLEIR